MTLLTPAERDAALSAMPRWRYDPARMAIVADFGFADFSQAWGWMARVALLAERRNHHPEWRNVYSRVEVAMTTHDAGGVTAADVDFARTIDGWAPDRTPDRIGAGEQRPS